MFRYSVLGSGQLFRISSGRISFIGPLAVLLYVPPGGAKGKGGKGSKGGQAGPLRLASLASLAAVDLGRVESRGGARGAAAQPADAGLTAGEPPCPAPRSGAEQGRAGQRSQLRVASAQPPSSGRARPPLMPVSTGDSCAPCAVPPHGAHQSLAGPTPCRHGDGAQDEPVPRGREQKLGAGRANLDAPLRSAPAPSRPAPSVECSLLRYAATHTVTATDRFILDVAPTRCFHARKSDLL